MQPTYAGFVILRLNEIWGIWAEGDDVKALMLSLRFADTLMIRKIKKKLQHDVEVIREAMNKAGKTRAPNFYSTQMRRNRELRIVARHYLGPFLSKLSDLLDEAGYYERTSTRLKSSDFKKLGDDSEA